jgi:hypothetical protein
LELAKTMERELQWKVLEAQNDTIQWGNFADSVSLSDDGWPGVLADAVWPSASDGPLCANCWTDLKVGIEVSIEVRSDAVEDQGEHSA